MVGSVLPALLLPQRYAPYSSRFLPSPLCEPRNLHTQPIGQPPASTSLCVMNTTKCSTVQLVTVGVLVLGLVFIGGASQRQPKPQPLPGNQRARHSRHCGLPGPTAHSRRAGRRSNSRSGHGGCRCGCRALQGRRALLPGPRGQRSRGWADEADQLRGTADRGRCELDFRGLA